MAVGPWSMFCTQCLMTRLTPHEFGRQLKGKTTTMADGRLIFKALLQTRHSICTSADPLPPRYLDILISSGTLTVIDALVVLASRWKKATESTPTKILPDSDVTTLQELTLLLMSSKVILDDRETRRCLLLTSKWLIALAHRINRPNNKSLSADSLLESLGMLLSTLSASNAGVAIISEDKVTAIVAKAVELSLSLFTLLSGSLVERLGAVQKHISMFAIPKDVTHLQALHFQSNLAELPMSASRAGTTNYLENMISNAKTIDDSVLYNFLAGRHNNDFLAMFLDCVLSSFLVLQRCMHPGRSPRHLQQAELFIRNKLPVVLSTISATSFASFAPEQALIESWQQVQSHLRPETTPCAQHFMHVCSLHHLITPEAAQGLVGQHDQTFSKGLYVKDELVAQVIANHSRGPKLVEELTKADGSAGPISQAIVETLIMYSQNKETQHLKDLANTIVQKPTAINAMAMFLRPTFWLVPLCSLLDNWRWEEIHGESQPLYDEFGSVLLLIITTKRRLCLSTSDMGLSIGFVARYIDREGLEDFELSEEAQKHLGDWIHALYVAEGLSDELTTSCSPQQFYFLVPTLLRQSLQAFQAGKVSQDALRGGLGFLLEPFLLPSVVSAKVWINNLNDQSSSGVMNLIFTTNDSVEIHRTISTMMESPEQFSFNSNSSITMSDFRKRATSAIESSEIPVSFLLQSHGPEASIECLLDVLIHFSGDTPQLLVRLDVFATLICVSGRELRDCLRLRLMKLGDLLKSSEVGRAQVTVHLHRRVESYASVLLVQEVPMEFVPLTNIDTTNASLDVNQTQEMTDDIDQVLNESAAMGNIIAGKDDTGLGIDDMYGLDGDGMGFGDLDDLDNVDLEMWA